MLAQLTLMVLLSPSAFAQAPGICDEKRIKVSGKTVEECEANSEIYHKGEYGKKCECTAWLREVESAVSECLRKVMDTALDKRLLVLKKADKERFKKEMRLQKTFNVALKKTSALALCAGGTADLLNADGIGRSFLVYRAKQAEAINRGQLGFQERDKDSGEKPAWPKEVIGFARGLCGMPAEVWKGGEAPDNCVKRALEDMEANKLGTPSAEECGQ